MIDDDADETTADEALADDPFQDMRAAGPWLDLIRDGQKAFQFYQDKCDSIDKLYADLERLAAGSADRQMQVFWANMEVLKPAIYARPPVPVVTPRFKKRAPLPRAAADMLERSLICSYDNEDLNSTIKLARDDVALLARGAMWLRLTSDDNGIQAVKYDHLERCDFVHDPARKWQEVAWVAKRAWLTAQQGKARFGEAFADVKLAERKNADTPDYHGEKVGEVWEIWHRDRNCVTWVSPGQDANAEVLDIRPPFLRLQSFWPCPQPAYATRQRGTLIPVPDFVYYRDQLEEINTLTARIAALAESLRLKGFYPAGSGDLAEAVETAAKTTDNRAILVPVSNFAALGGASLKDSIVYLPLADVASTIKECILLRQQLIQDVYQITGLSDIMRGATEASETATAQQLKAQYGNVRVRDRQEEMIRLCREVTEIAAEMIAENFSPEALLMYSQTDDLPTQQQVQQQMMAAQQQMQGMQQQAMMAQADPQVQQMAMANPQQAQQIVMQAQQAMQGMQQQIEKLQQTVTVDAVVQLLRSEKIRPFVLDIETNSTIQPDEMADKQARMEFIGAVGGFIQQAGPMVIQAPESAPFVAETLKFVAGAFRPGRAMDQAIDEFAEGVKQKAKQPRPPSKDQMDKETDDKTLQLDAIKHKDQMDLEWAKLSQTKEQTDKDREFAAVKGMVDDANTRDGVDFQREALKAKETGKPAVAIGADADAVGAALAKFGETIIQRIEQGDQALMKAVLSPREVKAIRGADGKLDGAISTPVVVN